MNSFYRHADSIVSHMTVTCPHMRATDLLQLWRSDLRGEECDFGEGVRGGGELAVELGVDILHIKGRGDVTTLLLAYLSCLEREREGGREGLTDKGIGFLMHLPPKVIHVAHMHKHTCMHMHAHTHTHTLTNTQQV